MTSRELNCMLIQWVPAIAANYKKEVEWQEGDETGAHITFGDVLVPYIIELVEEQDRESLKKIFEFIEHLVLLDEEYAEEVVMLSVLESLYYRLESFSTVSLPMKEKTRLCFERLKQGYAN